MNGVAIAGNGRAGAGKSQSAGIWNERFDRWTLLTGLWVFVGYYLGAKLGFALTLHPRPVAVLWPPNAILVAALLLTSPRVWWVFLLAALPAHWLVQLQSDVPPTMILCWYVSNCCEALIGASATRLFIGEPMRFNRLRNVGVFSLCVAFVGPFLSSFVDAGFVIWNHFGQGSFWEIWRIRLTSNVLAALTIAPLIVTWVSDGRLFLHKISPQRYIEGSLLFLVLLLTSFLALYQADAGQGWILPYLPLPFLLWAAVRFGSIGASTAIGTVAFLTIWSAAHEHGPFSAGASEQNALSVQIFLIVLAVPILFLGTLMEERATGETQLRESESRFRRVADAAPLFIWIAGPDKSVTFINKAWLDFTGRPMQEELGRGWRQVVDPDDLEDALREYESAFEARKPVVLRYRLRRHDGEYRSVSDTGVPHFGPQGNFRGYIGACVDVTDLLKQQKALHEIEERVALAADAARLGVWEFNTVTNELWMSDKARDLFDLDRDKPVTLARYQERIHPEDRSLHAAAMKGAIETRSGYEIEYRALLPDAAVRWIGGRARCVADDNGELTRLLGVSMDVTERREAQELFQLATEASPSGTLLVDGQGRILLVNAQVEKMFNYRREELIGKPVEVLVPERFATEYVALRAEFLGAPKVRPTDAVGEVSARRKDGSEFSVEVGLNPIQTPHGTLVLATVIDISARKLAEKQERETREEINRLTRIGLLGEMTASIAHELNQPLSGIASNANAGQRFIDRGDADIGMLREILVDIAADGRRANDVINNIRNTIKKGAAIRKRINMNDIITDVTHMVRPDTVACSCQLRLSLAKDLPVVEGDPIQIQQVLINLVTNACDAMRNVPPSRRNVDIATEKNADGGIRVSVHDYGTGISEDVREHLFDQFFTTKEEGLGMGLAIVRSIIEAHGGKIDVENLHGDGACFYFTLPTTMGVKE